MWTSRIGCGWRIDLLTRRTCSAKKLMVIPQFSPYMRDGTKYLRDPWSEEHKERVMNISCAENILTWPEFEAKFGKYCTLHKDDNM